MKNKFISLLLCCCALFCNTLFAIDESKHSFTSTADAARYQTLTNEIRCLVCQNQNIADSNAPLANDLREKVYQMILAQKTNDDIKNFLVERYGEFILLNPRLNKSTALLWAFPFLGLGVAVCFLMRVFRKQFSLPHLEVRETNT